MPDYKEMSKDIVTKYRTGELEMDDIFTEMFGEKSARSMFAEIYLDYEMYKGVNPGCYDSKEDQRKLICDLLLTKIEYYRRQDSAWYE